MRLKHHILLYTFLGVAVLISIFLTLDYGNRAQRSAQALEDAYAQRVLETQEHFSFTSPLRGTANKPDPPVWLVCNIKINVSAEYTQGAAEDLLNQKLSLSSHIHRSR